MACNCEIEKLKNNREYVRDLAVRFAALISAPVRFYRKHSVQWGTQYDFEPASEDLERDVIEIINTEQ